MSRRYEQIRETVSPWRHRNDRWQGGKVTRWPECQRELWPWMRFTMLWHAKTCNCNEQHERWQGDKVIRWQGGKVKGDKVVRWESDKVVRWESDKVTRMPKESYDHPRRQKAIAQSCGQAPNIILAVYRNKWRRREDSKEWHIALAMYRLRALITKERARNGTLLWPCTG